MIELNVVTYDTLYSSLTLWLGQDQLGDLEEPMYLASALGSLNVLRRRPLDCPDIIFESWEQYPGFEAMQELGSWSWTSSFDRIEYVYFVVRDPRLVCFQWKGPLSYRDERSESPSKLISYEIPFAIYDEIVDELNKCVKKWLAD